MDAAYIPNISPEDRHADYIKRKVWNSVTMQGGRDVMPIYRCMHRMAWQSTRR